MYNTYRSVVFDSREQARLKGARAKTDVYGMLYFGETTLRVCTGGFVALQGWGSKEEE